MRRSLRTQIVLVCAAVVLLFAAAGFAGDDSNMAAKLQTWQNSYNAGDFAAVAALYADDGCRMPPNAVTVNGREAIQESLVQGHEQAIAQVNLGLTMSSFSGEQANATGTYEILDEDGKPIDQGKWMNMSRNTAEGWMIQCDIWNSDLPMPEPDPNQNP